MIFSDSNPHLQVERGYMNKLKKEKNRASAVREQSVGWMLKSLSAQLDREMSRALKPYGLNLGRFAILMTLLEEDGLTQSEIGKKNSMRGYTTTRNLDVLEANGLVQRHKHETSRRSFCIRLAQEGKSLEPTLFSIVKSINENTLSSLDEEEILQLKKLLTKMLR